MNPSTLPPARLARLRATCLAFPGAVEKEAWGDPTWRVRDRIFAMQKGNHPGGRPSLWLKAEPGAREALLEGDPRRFFVPPYVGSKGWIGIHLDGPAPDFGLIRDLVGHSYALIAPRRKSARRRKPPR